MVEISSYIQIGLNPSLKKYGLINLQ